MFRKAAGKRSSSVYHFREARLHITKLWHPSGTAECSELISIVPKPVFASSIPTFRTIRLSPATGYTPLRMKPAASRSVLHSRSLRSLPPVTASMLRSLIRWPSNCGSACETSGGRMNSTINKLPFCGMTTRRFLRIVIASASRRPCRTCLSMYTSGARRDRLRKICCNQFASGGRIFIREASFGCIHVDSRSTSMPRRLRFSASTARMSDPPPPPRSATTFAREKSHASAIGA
jgi:hypothetical protein